MVLEKSLQEIGLSDKEAVLYLALLQVDSASVLDLAKKTKINRTTIYFILDSLAKKGLVSEVQTGKKIHYAAETPERLETFIERQKTILEEHSRHLKDIIPEIKAIQREAGERPMVKYFEGKEGAFNSSYFFFADTDKENKEEGYFIFNRDLIEEVFTPEEIAKVQKIRPTKTIEGKSLYNSEKLLESDMLTQRKRINKKNYPILCDISIYQDKILIITLGKRISSILIQSRDVAESFKSLFRLGFDKTRGE